MHDKSSLGLWPGELNNILAIDTVRTARFTKKSLGSDVGEIKKMSEKLKKSRCAARVHNVFSLAEILKVFLSETTKPIEL
jgi:hypothetical protein